MSLRARLILGYLAFVAVLAGLGGWSAWLLRRMSRVPPLILAHNYDSVVAAQDMKESLEREDSAALFLLLGQRERALHQREAHRRRFADALSRAAGNITEPGEAELIAELQRDAAAYDAALARFFESGGAERVYFAELGPQFDRLRADADRLLEMNQRAMRSKADRAAVVADRWFVTTAWLSVGLVGAGVGLAFVLARAMVGPIEVERMKSEFVATASHELRTPLTTLQMGVNLLLEGAAGPLADRQREVLLSCRDEAQRLERLLRELLDMARIEAGALRPRMAAVAPAALLRAVAERLRPQVEAKGLRLQVESPATLPEVDADAGQIERVIANLVSNAVRATPEGGTVTLRASALNGRVAFAVRDTGQGIPPEWQPRIFDRFVQVPGATAGGAGLGLAISQRIVNAHGGRIEVVSEPGRGAEFAFALPNRRST